MSIGLTSKKGQLTSEELTILQIELEKRAKNPIIAYLLWWFVGFFGGHRFYLGDTGYAIAMLCLNWVTCGLWWIIDVFFIGKRMEQFNTFLEIDIINEILAHRQK